MGLLPVAAAAQSCSQRVIVQVLEQEFGNARVLWPKGEIHVMSPMHQASGARQISQIGRQIHEDMQRRGFLRIDVIQARMDAPGQFSWDKVIGASLEGVVEKIAVTPTAALRSDPSFLEDSERFSITEGKAANIRIVKLEESKNAGEMYCLAFFTFDYAVKDVALRAFHLVEGGLYSPQRKARGLFRLDVFSGKWTAIAVDTVNASSQDFRTNSVPVAMGTAGLSAPVAAIIPPAPPDFSSLPPAPNAKSSGPPSSAPATPNMFENAGLLGINIGMTKEAADAAARGMCDKIEMDVKVENGFICNFKPSGVLINGYIAWALSSRGRIYSIYTFMAVRRPNAAHQSQCKEALTETMAGFPKHKLIVVEANDILPNSAAAGPTMLTIDHRYDFEGQPKHASGGGSGPALWFHCSNVDRYSPRPADTLSVSVILKDMRLH